MRAVPLRRRRLRGWCIVTALGVWHVPYAGASATDRVLAQAPGVALPADVFAPTVTAGAAATARLGAPFTLFVTAVTHAETPVNLVEPVQLGAGFEIRRRVQRDRRLADGRRERQWQFEVWAWQLGAQQMAPITLSYLAGTTLASVRTAPVTIEVIGVFGHVDAPPALAPALPPRPLWVPWWTPLWGAIAAAAVLGLAGWGWRQRWQRQHSSMRLGAPRPAPHAIAPTEPVCALQRALRAVVRAEHAPAAPRRTAQAMLRRLTQFQDGVEALHPTLQPYARVLDAGRAQLQLASYGEVELTHAHCVALCEWVCAMLASVAADGVAAPALVTSVAPPLPTTAPVTLTSDQVVPSPDSAGAP